MRGGYWEKIDQRKRRILKGVPVRGFRIRKQLQEATSYLFLNIAESKATKILKTIRKSTYGTGYRFNCTY
jgi:hypothetical protein